ncbi:MAG: HAMP domain-containing protein [Nitrospiraceae bacterium]|nr:MAG: HAMP domain-containing protein [Nitrospiraceae bacterium]
MRSLFIKIFLWFWLASILIIVSTLVLLSLIEPYRPVREDGRYVRRLAYLGTRAVEVLDREGSQGLQRFLDGLEQGPGAHVYLFNEKIESAAGGQAPPEARELAARAGDSGMTEFVRLDRALMVARPLYGSGGRTFIVLGEMPRHHRGPAAWRFLNPRFLTLRLLAVFIVSSIFCSWLAWYLTAPARKLRAAARQLASGDLKTRVGPELGERRDELADLGRDFDVMAERLESLVSSRDRLLRDISHELRSPLARLNVALELARQRSGREAEEPLNRIEKEAERMNILIGELRTLTLLESSAESLDRKSVDLSRLVRDIAGDADFESGDRKGLIKADLEVSVIVEGSEELLRRAIENVVRNAVRYAAGENSVEITLRRIQSGGRESALVTVRDHGPGVPEEALASLFIPFYRVAESRDRQSGGMGIGLAITDRAVRLHRGNVQAFNATGGGLEIRIDLPASRP